ncbi:6-aminohexanoate-dimer hydrolase [Aquimixticola soesokkakensis]|uniref:6-aminohexanoate-dimer hydrolase n=1 Tax=Aquimixticola soesokkakensis TaxID=1519096 RepID=A0A1Y5T7Z2_9RHOB|nr:serine hydrolase [Aquimixticola soesokkakensis]SLN55856.1 6-aminohexanoate-dimer hydrolase [Aquimixticola soesokkakensis]
MHRRRFLSTGVSCGFALGLGAGIGLSALRPAQAQQRRAPESYEDALRRLPQMNALLIQKGDQVVFEAARQSGGLDRPTNIKSCSKSLVALLLGAAIARGEIADVTARLGDVAPDLIPRDATAGVADITLQDLVTLRAGLAGTSGRDYGAWVASDNWVSYVLRQPMIAEPGGRMIYSTGSTHVLGAVLAQVSGLSLLDQARSRLGAPLGIDIPPWTRDPQGYYFGGNEMALSPRAMLTVARMMRARGALEGRAVIAQDWIDASFEPRTKSPYSGLAYGYGWFLSQSGYVLARGYGGQVIAIHPARDLAIAIASDPTLPARSQGYFGDILALLNGPVLDA